MQTFPAGGAPPAWTNGAALPTIGRPPHENDSEFADDHPPEYGAQTASALHNPRSRGVDPPVSLAMTDLRCPKCRESMEAVEADGVEIDRCTGCGGIWFDAGELDWLAQSEIAEAIDVGEPAEGEAMNELTRIDCPRCGRPTRHIADPYKPHIRYEICSGCEGVFLDAGEFRDLARLSLGDLLRHLLPRRSG